MNKKVILGTIFTFSLVFSGLNHTTTYALEESISGEGANQPIELNDEIESVSDESGVMPISETNSTTSADKACAEGYISTPNGCMTPEEWQNILDNGTSGESEVVCADKTEPGCEDTDTNPEIVDENGDTEELEPELWPLIVSLSALGATVLFVIIINLFGHQK